jgi:hypothetical protein
MVSEVLTIVCTNRDRHPSVKFGDASISAAIDLPAVDKRPAQHIPERVNISTEFKRDHRGVPTEGHLVIVEAGVGDTAFRFRCPHCGLDRPLRQSTTLRVVRDLLARGVSLLDVSALPANFSSSTDSP